MSFDHVDWLALAAALGFAIARKVSRLILVHHKLGRDRHGEAHVTTYGTRVVPADLRLHGARLRRNVQLGLL